MNGGTQRLKRPEESTKNACAVVAAVILTAACVTTNAAVMNERLVRPSINADSVVLYRSPQEVPRRYDEVAIPNSKGDAELTDEAKMYNSMRKKAAELGANGVILENTKGPPPPRSRHEGRQGIVGHRRQSQGRGNRHLRAPDTTLVSKQ